MHKIRATLLQPVQVCIGSSIFRCACTNKYIFGINTAPFGEWLVKEFLQSTFVSLASFGERLLEVFNLLWTAFVILVFILIIYNLFDAYRRRAHEFAPRTWRVLAEQA